MSNKHSALHPLNLLKTKEDVIVYLQVALSFNDPDLFEVACEEAVKVFRAKGANMDKPASPSLKAVVKTFSADDYTYSATWSPQDSEYIGLVEEIPGLIFLSPRKEHALQGVKASVDKLIFMHQELERLLTEADKSFSEDRFMGAEGAILRLQERYSAEGIAPQTRLAKAAKAYQEKGKLRYKGITSTVKYDAWDDLFYGELDVEDGYCGWDAGSEEEIALAFMRTVELYLRDEPFQSQRHGATAQKNDGELHYKGYTSTPAYSIPDHMIYGKLDLEDDLVLWESETVEGVEAAFHEAVEAYIDTDAETDSKEE